MENTVNKRKVIKETIKRDDVTKKTTRKRNIKPTFEQIKIRAYEIHAENGFKGDEIENWLRAEKELSNS